MSADLTDTIDAAAIQPKRVKTDAGEVEAHSLADLKAAQDDYEASQAMSKPQRGLRFTKFVQPGSI